jgi:hypothetical protein
LDFPQLVVNRQQSFLSLTGGRSSVPVTEVEPNFTSFVKNTPQAITLSMARPYPSDVRHLPSLAAAAEISLLILVFVVFLLFRRKKTIPTDTTIYFCIFFAVSMLLSIGFSNNNLGAIVRYRSVLLPLLMIPIAAHIDWNRLLSFFSGGAKEKPSL